MRPADSAHGRSSPLLLPTFLGIAALFLISNLIDIRRAQEVRRTSNEIVDNMVASIELVSRMWRDIDRVHVLVEHYIAERDPSARTRIEEEIARTDADREAAMRAYAPLTTLPSEAEAWETLRSDAAALDEPIRQVLAFASRNRDEQARAAMRPLEDRYRAVGHEAATLIELNRNAAEMAAKRIDRLQRSSVRLLGGLALLGTLVTLSIGLWARRLVQRREHELARYSSLLEARNRELDAFAGRVAHDLRGPLTTISLAGSRLASLDAEKTALLQRAVARMTTLIDDLLALSRLEGTAQEETGDPAAAASDLREDLEARVKREGATLRIDVESATLPCPQGLLRQVLWNLADNGLKYRRPATAAEIEIRGRPTDGSYELRVTDNGIGMSPDEARHAFDPYYRAKRLREAKGTGLGLSIVKRVVDACGGTISLHSELGRGTTCVIRFALKRRD
jgi:signal transduction histidine kinase